ncbi:MAG: MFS transporter [Flavobacteriales bacterium]|nr:MFS transporter [Flavobacteriales bacterium]
MGLSYIHRKFFPAYLLNFANSLGTTVLMPILPFIILGNGAPKWVFGLFISLYSIFQFIGSPVLGAMSDRLGRKPVLLISHVGTLLSWFIFLGALYSPKYELWGTMLPLWIIGVSRILDGLTGGNTSVANAYVADITTRKEKLYIFGYIGGITGVAMMLGPGIGGFTASRELGHAGTILTAIFISVITLISIFAWLKESLPVEKRVKANGESILGLFNISKRMKVINPDKQIKVLFVMKLLFTAMMGTYIGSIALFIIDTFGFDEKELGMFMLVVGLFLAFNQAFVSKVFIKRLGEFKTLILGLLLVTIGLFSITMTSNLYYFFAYYYVMNLGLSLCFPTFNALIAIHANNSHKGETLGVSESISSFSLALFPVLSAIIYTIIGEHLFHFVSCLPFVGLILGLFSTKIIKD